jgi:carbon monoxide dehydrogenase subunit G
VIRIELALEIGRPAEEVFDYLADIERLSMWQSSAVETHMDGPMGVGARFSETRRLFGREGRTELEVKVFEPSRRLTLRSLSGPVRVSVDHELESQGDGTLLNVVAETEPGPMLKLARPLLARQAERELRRDFERLKELLERGS